MDPAAVHDEKARRFTIDIDSESAFIEYSMLDNGTLDIQHTFVPTSLRGQGLAAVLMKAVCQHAKDQGRKLLPTCSYADTYIRKHSKEYGDLIDQSRSYSATCKLP